jgi:hypothetical protein
MGRRAGRSAAAVAVALLVTGAVSATAGAGSAKVRAPKIEHISGSVASMRASITANIDPEKLATSYQLALLYKPASCCVPGTKKCCTPEVEVVATGNLAASSSSHEVHGSAKLREGNYAVRVRVEADSSAGSSEKSRALKLPR